MSSRGPKEVLIIRHGEKLGDPTDDAEGGPNLSIRGSARAAALPSLFVPAAPAELSCALDRNGKHFKANYVATKMSGQAPRFPTPEFLFATKASAQSNRPVETITPLSAALNMDYDHQYDDADYAKLADHVLTHSKYQDKILLICWHHGHIQKLAAALHVNNPPKWPGGNVFDRVWNISYSKDTASLKDRPQMLLYGDTNS